MCCLFIYVFSQETPEILIKFGAYLGATVGRVANRIGGGKFSLGMKKRVEGEEGQRESGKY